MLVAYSLWVQKILTTLFLAVIVQLLGNTEQQKSADYWLGSPPSMRVLRGDLYYYDLGRLTNTTEPIYTAIDADPSIVRIRSAVEDTGKTISFAHSGCDQIVPGLQPYRFVLLCQQSKLIAIKLHPETKEVTTMNDLTRTLPTDTQCSKIYSESARKDVERGRLVDFGNRLYLLCSKAINTQSKLTVLTVNKSTLEIIAEIEVAQMADPNQKGLGVFDISGGLITITGEPVVTIMIFEKNPQQIGIDLGFYLLYSNPEATDPHKLGQIQHFSGTEGTIRDCSYPLNLTLAFHSVFFSRFSGSDSSFYITRLSTAGDLYSTKLQATYGKNAGRVDFFSCELKDEALAREGKVTEKLEGSGLSVSLKLFEDVYGGSNSLLVWTPLQIKEALLTSSVSFKISKQLIDLAKYKLKSITDVFVIDKILYIVGLHSNNSNSLIRSKQIEESKFQDIIPRMDQLLDLGQERICPLVFADEIDANKQGFVYVSDKSITVGKVAYNMLRATMASNGSQTVEHIYEIGLQSGRYPGVESRTNMIEYQIVPDFTQIRADEVPAYIDIYTGTPSYVLPSHSSALMKLTGNISVTTNSNIKINYKLPTQKSVAFAPEAADARGFFRVGPDVVGILLSDGVVFVRCKLNQQCEAVLTYKLLTPAGSVQSFKVLAAIQSTTGYVLVTEEVQKGSPDKTAYRVRVFLNGATNPSLEKTLSDRHVVSSTLKYAQGTESVILYAILGNTGELYGQTVAWLHIDLKNKLISDWTVALTLPDYICAKSISAKLDATSSGFFDIISQCSVSTKVEPRVYSWSIPLATQAQNISSMVNSFVLFPPTQADGSISTLKYCSFGAGVLLVFSGKSSTEAFNARFTDPSGFNLARMVYGLSYFDIKEVLQLECLPESTLANLLVRTKSGKTLAIGLEFFESGKIFDRIAYSFELPSDVSRVFSLLSSEPIDTKTKFKVLDLVFFSPNKEDGSKYNTSSAISITPLRDYYRIYIDTTGMPETSGNISIKYQYLDGVTKEQSVSFQVHSKKSSISQHNSNKIQLMLNDSGSYPEINLEEALNLSGDYLNARLVGLDLNSDEMKSLQFRDRFLQTDILKSSLYTFSKFMAYKSYILAPVEGGFLYLLRGNRLILNKRCQATNMKMIIQDDVPTFFASIKTLEAPVHTDNGPTSQIAIISKVSQITDPDEEWGIVEYPLAFNSVRTLKVSSWGPRNHFVYSLTTQDNLNKSKIFVGVLRVTLHQRKLQVENLYEQFEISFDYPINDYMMVPTHNGSAIITVSTQYKSSIQVLMVRPDTTNKSLEYFIDTNPALAKNTANIAVLGCTGLGQFDPKKPWYEKHFLCTLVPESSAVFFTINITVNLQPTRELPLVVSLGTVNQLKAIDGFRPMYAMTERQMVIFYSKNILPEANRTDGIYKEDLIVQVYDMAKDTYSRKVICSQTLQTPTIKEDKTSKSRVVAYDAEYPSRVFFNSSESRRPDYMAISYYNPVTFSSGIVTFQESNLSLKILSEKYVDTILDKVEIELTDINYKTVRIPLKNILYTRQKFFTVFAYIITAVVIAVTVAIIYLGWKMLKVRDASSGVKASASAGPLSYQSSFNTDSDVYYAGGQEDRPSRKKKQPTNTQPEADDMLAGKINEEL